MHTAYAISSESHPAAPGWQVIFSADEHVEPRLDSTIHQKRLLLHHLFVATSALGFAASQL
jgi:hypothetical protein